MLTAPRGKRHGFSNPFGSPALVLGIWAPSGPALAFMRDVGGRPAAGHATGPGGHARRVRQAREPAAALAEDVRHRGVGQVVRLGDRRQVTAPS